MIYPLSIIIFYILVFIYLKRRKKELYQVEQNYLNSLDMGNKKDSFYWGRKYYSILRFFGPTKKDLINIKNDIDAKCK